LSRKRHPACQPIIIIVEVSAVLLAFVLVLLAVAVGDVVTEALSLPIPGSILGLLGAAGLFAWRGEPSPSAAGMFDAVIPYAPLLFVPAGAGVVANLDLIAGGWLPIAVAITLGTAGALLATGLAAQFLLQRLAAAERGR
jgi:holin-like protein